MSNVTLISIEDYLNLYSPGNLNSRFTESLNIIVMMNRCVSRTGTLSSGRLYLTTSDLCGNVSQTFRYVLCMSRKYNVVTKKSN